MSEQTHPCPAYLAQLVEHQFSPEPELWEEGKMPWEREMLGGKGRSWGLGRTGGGLHGHRAHWLRTVSRQGKCLQPEPQT